MDTLEKRDAETASNIAPCHHEEQIWFALFCWTATCVFATPRALCRVNLNIANCEPKCTQRVRPSVTTCLPSLQEWLLDQFEIYENPEKPNRSVFETHERAIFSAVFSTSPCCAKWQQSGKLTPPWTV